MKAFKQRNGEWLIEKKGISFEIVSSAQGLVKSHEMQDQYFGGGVISDAQVPAGNIKVNILLNGKVVKRNVRVKRIHSWRGSFEVPEYVAWVKA